MIPPVVTEGATHQEKETLAVQQRSGKYVIIYLQTMYLELHDGTTTIAVIPLLSQGKPGSYYETIGGIYANDYKVPLHFSSIGHVYMPYSVHLFGNYFIHGVPYYPNGEKVSSTYSGGCIRLTDDDAKRVYDFIERGTPIIVTRSNEESFTPTATTTNTLQSQVMTNLMVATISLELLTQDNEITDIDGIGVTTRRKLLPELLNNGNTIVAHQYADSLGNENFVNAMNKKAKALGLTNTIFESVDSSASTTFEDNARFMEYIKTYKSYLIKLQDTEDRKNVRP